MNGVFWGVSAMDDRNETLKSDNRYIRQIMKQSLLERDDEHQLAIAWRDQQDERALHQLVLAYSRLVVSIASKSVIMVCRLGI